MAEKVKSIRHIQAVPVGAANTCTTCFPDDKCKIKSKKYHKKPYHPSKYGLQNGTTELGLWESQIMHQPSFRRYL